MTDRFEIIPLEQLADIIFNQLRGSDSVFGIPREAFFTPRKNDLFKTERYGQILETPIGVAAGPHTQLAQNIVSAWLTGARFIELKTVQTLDELEISKPCIDMQDEGYNCEWSQELKIEESFHQYLNALILIHLLKAELGHDLSVPGFIFNMSVGYDYQGIMNDNVQWFFRKMKDATPELEQKIALLEKKFPQIRKLHIAPTLSDNITLSTMHGCPPDEIESIGKYLITEQKLHTTVKLNPTLLGKEELRSILRSSGFKTEVPDIAFEHDLKFNDAVEIIEHLQQAAKQNGLSFGIKLTNTLESNNNKNVFPAGEQMMYMSGRALHPISVNLAKKLQQYFRGTLDISFSGGADALNVSELLSCGLKPVTVCSDILKPGGYGRLGQYLSNIKAAFEKAGAGSPEQFIAISNGKSDLTLSQMIVENLTRYAGKTKEDPRYKNLYFRPPSIKTGRPLGFFDCIHAPCQETCPTRQGIPSYMYYTAQGDFLKAYDVISETNAFPYTTGMVCDHSCTTKCTRINYDEPLNIREIKRFVTEYAAKHDYSPKAGPASNAQKRVAVIGAGPGGLSCARYLAEAGFTVEVFEAKSRPGGTVAGAIPPFRLPDEALQHDINTILNLGVTIHFNSPVDKAMFQKMQNDFDALFIAAGAQKTRKLMIEGGNLPCVLDPLDFLSQVKIRPDARFKNKNIAVIGGGNTAIDTARTALRLTDDARKVTVLYRRRIEDMPAEPEEITALMDEGIKIIPLVSPKKINPGDNGTCLFTCTRMKAGDPDEQGRAVPVAIPGSDFTLSFDIIIPAVGQDADIGFVPKSLLKTRKGSYRTRMENVYLGGDALRGASTIINAVADGKNAALEIIADLTGKKKELPQTVHPDVPYKELKLKKYLKKNAVPVPVPEPQPHDNFSILTQTYTPQQAKEEASRCLLCDEVCDVCTTVCPNLAFHSYSVMPQSFPAGTLSIKGHSAKIVKKGDFHIRQNRQIVHLADWCNQCGNCATFCPTAGKPYLDKPHLYLLKTSFENNKDGFYYDKKSKTVEHYIENVLFRLQEEKNVYRLSNSRFTMDIHKKDFQTGNITITETLNMEIPLQRIW